MKVHDLKIEKNEKLEMLIFVSCKPGSGTGCNISNNIFESKNAKPILSKVESIQYTAARIITGAWKGSNMLKLYETLGWESMSNRREMKKLVLLFEIMETKSPRYLYDIIKKQQFRQNSRLYEKKDLINIPSKGPYKLSFFPSTILDWNKLDKLDPGIKQAKSKNIFKNRLLNKIRPKKRSFVGLSNDRIRYLTML